MRSWKRIAIGAGIATVMTAVPAQALAAIKIHKIYFEPRAPIQVPTPA